MRPWSLVLAATALVAALAPPAAASTMPRVDFQGGETFVAAGWLDVNYDRAIDLRWALGFTAGYHGVSSTTLGPPLSLGLRATRRVGELGAITWGWTAAGGIEPRAKYVGAAAFTYKNYHVAWLQPALVAAWPLGPVTLRASVGPLFTGSDIGSFWGYSRDYDGAAEEHAANMKNPLYYLPSGSNLLWPGVEIAFPIGKQHEITLLGNGIAGWRGTF